MTTHTSRIFKVSALLAAMLPVMQASAAGFQVSEHSAAGLGRAFAGEAAMADDASVVARNPAGMSLIDRTTITLVGSYIVPNIEVKNGGKLSGSKSVANEAFVPAAYIVMPYNDKWSFGFGANTNFGFGTDYGTSSGLTTHGDESEIVAMNFNGSVAYKFSDRFSFGFGLNAVHTEAKMSSSLGNIKLLEVEGDNWAIGWNAGVLFQATERTRLGLSYRAKVKNTLEGKAKTQIEGDAEQKYFKAYNSKGSVDLTLPAIAELSIHHDLNDTLSLQASWQRTYWSSFDELKVEYKQPGAEDNVTQHQWSDADRISLGMTWDYTEKLTFRAGIAKDESPVASHYRTVRIPDADRMWYTFGAGYKLNDNSSVDFAYGYIKGDDADIYERKATPVAKISHSSAHVFSAQYNYRF